MAPRKGKKERTTKTYKPHCKKKDEKCKACMRKNMQKSLHEAKKTCDLGIKSPCRQRALAIALTKSTSACRFK